MVLQRELSSGQMCIPTPSRHFPALFFIAISMKPAFPAAMQAPVARNNAQVSVIQRWRKKQ